VVVVAVVGEVNKLAHAEAIAISIEEVRITVEASITVGAIPVGAISVGATSAGAISVGATSVGAISAGAVGATVGVGSI